MYVSITAPLPANSGMGAFGGAPFPWPVSLRAKPRRRGFGATPSNTNIASGLITGANVGAATAIGTGSEIAGGIAGGLEAIAPFTGPAAPVIAAMGALVGPIATFFKGCGVTCQKTTQVANQVASAAGQITSLYWGQGVRTVSMQQAAIQNLQQLYSYLVQNCQAVGGQGGAQCIADRQPGGKYDFQAQQIAPIQNDTAVVPDPSPVTTALATIPGVSDVVAAVSGSSFLLPLGLALGAWLLLE